MDIQGIGPKTVEKLLKTFGSVHKIKETAEEELIGVVGKSTTKKLKDYFSTE